MNRTTEDCQKNFKIFQNSHDQVKTHDTILLKERNMYRTRQFHIKKNSRLYPYCKDLCSKSAGLYNLPPFLDISIPWIQVLCTLFCGNMETTTRLFIFYITNNLFISFLLFREPQKPVFTGFYDRS